MIIVKRLGAQGDVILTTPVIRALRRQRPAARILVVTRHPEVFFGNPDVDQILETWNEARDRQVTIDLDMSYETMPGQHIVAAYAGRCGLTIQESDWRPSLYFDRISKYKVEEILPPGKRYAVLHPGLIAGWAGRQWPVERFVDVAARLRAGGLEVVLVGSKDDPALPVDYDIRGIGFQELCAVMHRATAFLGVDSMPFHVAQAFAIPSTVIFGSIRPELRIIPGLPVRPVRVAELACLGCFHRQLGDARVISSCPEDHERCMKDLTVDRVMEEVRF